MIFQDFQHSNLFIQNNCCCLCFYGTKLPWIIFIISLHTEPAFIHINSMEPIYKTYDAHCLLFTAAQFLYYWESTQDINKH